MRIALVMVAAVLIASSARAERLRGPDGAIRDVPEASVEFALRDGYQRLPKVLMRTTSGGVVEIDEDAAADAERQGLWRMTPSEVLAHQRDVAAYRSAEYERDRAETTRLAHEEDFGGASGVARALVAGLARGATLTLSDRLMRLDDQYAIDLRFLSEVNPWSSRIGTALGVLLLVGLIAWRLRGGGAKKDDAWRRKLREIK